MLKRALLLGSLLLAVAGCPTSGGSGDDDDDTPPPDPCEGYEQPDGVFADYSDEEQRLYMQCVVMPEFTPIFREFDADEYANFSCDTCHGEGSGAAGDFEMPNDDLFTLEFSGFPYSQDPDPEIAAYGEFMEDEVVFQMAELLGRSTDFQSPDFFGCYGCHP